MPEGSDMCAPVGPPSVSANQSAIPADLATTMSDRR